MSFNFSKKDGVLIFDDKGGYQTRNPSTIWCIQKADELYTWDDFPTIKVDTGDVTYDKYIYSYSKPDSFERLIPDFNFRHWQETGVDDYTNTTKQIDLSGVDSPTIQKVGWIGNTRTNCMRTRMLEIGEQHPDLFEFSDMYWMASDKSMLNSSKYISTPDLVKMYAFLIDIEGAGYSGRLKYLLWSHRPVLLVDRPGKEYFFEYLKEWVHYIPVKRDLSDLVEKTTWCLNNYENACDIAENAYQFSKQYLTREACYKQWDTCIQASRKAPSAG